MVRCRVLGHMQQQVEATTISDRLRCLNFRSGRQKRDFAVVLLEQIQNISPSALSEMLLSELKHIGKSPCMKKETESFTWWKDVEQIADRWEEKSEEFSHSVEEHARRSTAREARTHCVRRTSS